MNVDKSITCNGPIVIHFFLYFVPSCHLLSGSKCYINAAPVLLCKKLNRLVTSLYILIMAKAINFEGLKKGSIRMLRFILEKLLSTPPPVKVKEGHFVVIATKGWESRRFVIALAYLNHPEFLKLLKQAEEEFGFSQEGALAIPCRPDELQKILCVQKL